MDLPAAEWHVSTEAPGPTDDAVVAATTGWPAEHGRSPLRWARAVMEGVHVALADERWGLDPLSLRLVEVRVQDHGGPTAGGPLEVDVTGVPVDLGQLGGLRLAVGISADGHLLAEAAATVAGRGDAVAGAARPEPLGRGTVAAREARAVVEDEVALAVAPEPVVAYAEWSRDVTPIHTDADAARAAGLPGRIAPGMWTVAVVAARAAVASAGPIGAAGARFIRPVVVGETLTTSARPGRDGDVDVTVIGPSGPVVRRAWARPT